MVRNLVVTGVGGQGVVRLATLLRRAVGRRWGRFAGYDERGGAQRYGPVAAVIRFRDDGADDEPLGLDMLDGTANWVVGLEASEPLRFNRALGAGTTVVLDGMVLPPTNVRRADGTYYRLDELTRHYGRLGCRVVVQDFRAAARARGADPRDANLLAAGALVRHMGALLDVDDLAPFLDDDERALVAYGYELGEVAP